MYLGAELALGGGVGEEAVQLEGAEREGWSR